ncbi:hypothetical protein AN4944.2 [Aspergillus nidulans FGSC A4]|uniref:Uncharacterized protein n=1 Tax=Emericella nidulans (strain FGSC A4 / ATCC 38163 / CBS 112.46 / NRRL 194 / M139) TaxID=227321 RepID=Q5B3D6_EMENI|nr:hypothetical protein [Aspergillus nidulans FGSC A4]EAA61022.1 hypothetical protein AN4944.2 [Aspergillus nidulans FGSC A4]CBF76425.1 TPA: conserved hypothetical protein [Aspergillus nidulans FGSC A4]|eukprot:XP_662548.1 hypothetical protein AN4944.2 [Aspergillus nidulans FGSC A4]
MAKQVLNAAKRASKKRSAPTENKDGSPQKKLKSSLQSSTDTPFTVESALALPVSTASEEELSDVVLITNRAPLVLAFAVCVLKYTMPEQPISSRLSLAQAVVSANSRSKAISLGLESDKPAEQEGWGDGLPTISVLGREIKVLKRWDYNPREGRPSQESQGAEATSDDILGQCLTDDSEPRPSLWGIDVLALKRGESYPPETAANTSKALPIHNPDAARSYLLKSFMKSPDKDQGESASSKRKSVTKIETEREACLSHLLRSIDMVCQSWASTLSAEDLDRRAWSCSTSAGNSFGVLAPACHYCNEFVLDGFRTILNKTLDIRCHIITDLRCQNWKRIYEHSSSKIFVKPSLVAAVY